MHKSQEEVQVQVEGKSNSRLNSIYRDSAEIPAPKNFSAINLLSHNVLSGKRPHGVLRDIYPRFEGKGMWGCLYITS